MFDSEYFRTALQADVDAAGGNAVVAMNFVNGRSYRLRSVVAVQAGVVVLEIYQGAVDGPAHRQPRWKAEAKDGETMPETHRAVVSYESIADVTVTPVKTSAAPSIGFLRA